MPENDQKIFSFTVEHLDPLGQGVHKNDGEISFIRKTLPGESGEAKRVKSKKGVHFATLLKLENKSSERIEADCPHFESCPGCDYLHTDYNNELIFKRNALNKSTQHIDFNLENSVTFEAPQRLGYRNRMQLHYRDGKLGLIDGLSNHIVEIPECKLLHPALEDLLDALYHDDALIKKWQSRGHVELYLRAGHAELSWNKPYATGGFTQVNDQMNVVLRDAVTALLRQGAHKSILDLFAGDGNLSQSIVREGKGKVSRMMVDNTEGRNQPDFVRLDLYKSTALKRFDKKCMTNTFDAMILDPPRSGFPTLNDWVKRYHPKHLVYVSCNAATLARDLRNIESPHVIDALSLVDLFPATRHFETLVRLTFPEYA